ncbi:MAG TPA: hypothetical protein PLZ55_05265, partial [bacterium]|nr:hypothetical protein [bacterium]
DYRVVAGHWSIGRPTARQPERDERPGQRGLAFAACEDYDPTIPEELYMGGSPPPYRDNPMVYRVGLYYKKGLMLGVCDRSWGLDILRWFNRDRDYTYNEDTGEIRLLGEELPFQTDKKQYLFARGVPRRDLFQFHGTLDKGSVQVTVNGKMLTEKEGFTVDYENRRVKILDPAVNDYRVKYRVAGAGQEYIDRWTHWEKSLRKMYLGSSGQTYPRIGSSTSGNIFDAGKGYGFSSSPLDGSQGGGYGVPYGSRAQNSGSATRTEGRAGRARTISPDHDPTVDYSKAIGQHAKPTLNPMVFQLHTPCEEKGLRASIVKSGDPENMRWLKRGQDYTYNEETGEITFPGEKVPFDENAGDCVHVSGIPIPGLFKFDAPIRQLGAAVKINGEEMEDGKDYIVDYEKNTIRVTNPAIQEKDAKYLVRAGNHYFSNIGSDKADEPKEAPGALSFADCEDYDPTVRNYVGTNAAPTNDPMVYQVRQPLQKKGFIMGMGDQTQGTGILRWFKRDRDYTYDEDTGEIRFPGDKLPFNPDKEEDLFISGVPRQDLFFFQRALEKGSVQVTLNGKELTEGDGFVVDYANGRVKVLNSAINEYRAKYKVIGGGKEFIDHWTREENMRRGEAEGHSVLSFYYCDDYDPDVDPKKTVGTDVQPTEDPKVWALSQKMQTKGMMVGVGSKGKPGLLRWWKRGRDYVYKDDGPSITLLNDNLLDAAKERIFLSGVPIERNVHYYHKQLTPGLVRVAMDGRILKEGEGFTVDYAKGIVTITDPAGLDGTYRSLSIDDDGDNPDLLHGMMGVASPETPTSQPGSSTSGAAKGAAVGGLRGGIRR